MKLLMAPFGGLTASRAPSLRAAAYPAAHLTSSAMPTDQSGFHSFQILTCDVDFSMHQL